MAVLVPESISLSYSDSPWNNRLDVGHLAAIEDSRNEQQVMAFRLLRSGKAFVVLFRSGRRSFCRLSQEQPRRPF